MSKRPMLDATHPHLLDEWDFERNEIKPNQVSHGSEKYVWWVCRKCKHSWRTRIGHRAGKEKTGCPACAGYVVTKNNNLSVTHPHLLDEWCYGRNTEKPSAVTKGMKKEVFWECKKCGYIWKALISNRAHISKPSGCPVCNGLVASKEFNFSVVYPGLLRDWDYDKNKVLPENIRPTSSKKVWWLCNLCGYSWNTVLYSRTINGNGCPACAGKVLTNKNRLSTTYPEIVKCWDYAKNNISPDDISYGSHKRVWWKCSACGYSWKVSVGNRVFSKTGCPACSGFVVTSKNSLGDTRPDISKEWDYSKNDISPNEVSYGSDKKVWWNCSTCGNTWKTQVNTRAVSGHGCPHCSGSPISKRSQVWLDILGIHENYREYRIHRTNFRVDAYDPENNTIYEFLGDYWHGNPKIYSAEKKHPVRKILYGQLYKETMKRLYKLKDMGYKVIYIWESDFIEGKTYSIL